MQPKLPYGRARGINDHILTISGDFLRSIEYTIGREDDGRLLKYVVCGTLGLSGGLFRSMKQSGRITLGGQPVMANRVMREGEVITVVLSDGRDDGIIPEDKPVNIVYSDGDVIIVDKCAPLACQSSINLAEGALDNRLAHIYSGGPFAFRPVNRLDKGTSGLMTVALHAHAHAALQRQLHAPGYYLREYLALICGRPEEGEGTVDAPILRPDAEGIRRVVHPEGRRAVTHYRTLWSGGGMSLVALMLETGRTHQIRVHMAHIGCPVFGDFLYGEEDTERLPGRFALHSAHLRFTHPVSGERMEFYSNLPDEIFSLTGLPGEYNDAARLFQM